MPRRNAVPSYCHNKASERAYVKLQGRRVYLGRWNTPESKAEYSRVLAELDARPEGIPLSAAALKATPDLTVNELALGFLEHVDAYYRKPDGRPTTEPGVIRIPIRLLARAVRSRNVAWGSATRH